MMRREYDTIRDRLDGHVRESPDQLALKFLRDDKVIETLTYAQLMSRSQAVAARLSGMAKPGDRVLLLYPQGLDFVVAFLGCLFAGVIAVSAYPPRRNRKSERIVGIVADCAPSLFLTNQECRDRLENDWLDLSPRALLITDDLSDAGEEFSPSETTSETVAWLQYTSGSTSAPRGVIITHGALLANVRQIATALDCWEEPVKLVSWLPMYHDMGLVGAILSPLFFGGQSVLMDPNSFLREPFSWLKAISDERGTFSCCPNFGFDLCVKAITDEQKKQLDLSCIRLIINAAEPVRADTMDRFVAKFGACGFKPEMMVPAFGLAEATLLVTGGPYGNAPRRVQIDAETSEPKVALSRNDSAT